jgi:hypothetical protein
MSTTKTREETLSDITGSKNPNLFQGRLWTNHPEQMGALKKMCSKYAECVRSWKNKQVLPLGNEGLVNVVVSSSCYCAHSNIHIATRSE